MNPEDIAVNLVKLNDGRPVGRTRLQKVAYLLDRSGANFHLPFTYHHYGPYSFDLADGWVDAKAGGRLEIKEQLGRHGVSYSIFTLGERENPDDADRLGDLSAPDARTRLRKMANSSNVVLELAATMVYLREEEGHGERTIEELKLRKPLKATDELVGRAGDLLRRLGPDPRAGARRR